MGLISSLFTGVSGLRGNAEAMGVIGDNISNVNTVGFKGSKAVFSDIFSTILSNGSTTSQLGRGSQLQGTIQEFSQGSFESSSNALDLALDGSGFFVVNNGAGNFYTRAGQFRLNDDGLVQAITGEILQGSSISNGVVSTSTTDIDLAGVQSSPQATTTFTLGANLDASATAATTFTSPVTTYNSVGTQIIVSLQFTKVSGANQWTYAVSPSDGTVTSGASGTVTFDTSGALSSPTTDQSIVIDFSAASTPAATQTLTWDLVDASGNTNGKLTGFAAASNNNSLVQDGFTTGTLVGLTVATDGKISGLFNNGQTAELFQVALADFLAPSGLTRQGSNLFAESADSGQSVLGFAETGGFGSVVGQSLELSNVDLAEQFVTMIQTQQAFQASARIITTTDDLLTEAVNLVR
ncbi:MAG: flagellar hook protein FlgE [Nitrospina sp.]|jgi:flagellar hook protein FlgE|nr:flagellar hook protein FlgE [Nitrospina sp.]MBT3414594.1 flagellar hook protein FlgE [Nitrospina sp.]MBT3855405.1 flagellar hook protein FlgE [Nitrospina sp.]MBT4106049.1 flagellar hook protein FlgE [Nitrospina sp.]MBT4620915.1 flagellar hook protein FlgE [Nitrospina sp.]